MSLNRIKSGVCVGVWAISSGVSYSEASRDFIGIDPVAGSVQSGGGQVAVRTAATEMNAQEYIEIEFPQGSALLSENAKARLMSVVEQAQRDGAIDNIMVFSWADADYPSKNRKTLPRAQRRLAELRSLAISEFLKHEKNMTTENHNMAIRPSLFARWFNSKDQKVKESFLAAGIPTTAEAPIYTSKASHAVVFLQLKNEGFEMK